MKLRLQRKALFLDLVPSSHDFVLAPATAPGILSRMYACVDDPKHFVLLNRIERAMSNLKNIGRVSDMTEMLHAQSQNDEDHLESSYTIIRGFIWGIPVLGFIGTVLGLAKAMSGFGETLRAGTDVYQLTESLKQITGGLSTAFEATLIGLVSALTIQLTLTSLKKREEGFLDDCKEYCHANIVSRLRLIQLDDSIASGEANR
jgi:biopolymer transport protein ExbB/TolQ